MTVMYVAAFLTVAIRGWPNDVKERGIDELNRLECVGLTPQGRGSFYASLDYRVRVRECKRQRCHAE
jgi:hypothetical protein